MRDRKISVIYDEIMTTIQNIDHNMSPKKRDKLLKIIKENKKYFGLNINPYVMTHNELKDIPMLIRDNMNLVRKNSPLLGLKLLKEKIIEEPKFLEQFNF